MTWQQLIPRWRKPEPTPIPTPEPEQTAYLPLKIAVSAIPGGVAITFDVGDKDLIVVLSKRNALQLVDIVLDAVGAPEPDEPRAS